MPDVSELIVLYQVDLPHARQVADHALALFDAVVERYDLLPAYRRLIEVGALLHNVGLTIDPPEHHLVGRDIVLRHVIEDLGPRERALVACMVAFHRKKVRPQLEPAYLALGKRGQREALQLAAILRVADGLDYSQSQTTRLTGVTPGDGGLTLALRGPHAAEDGARAVAKADLWQRIFGEGLQLAVEAPADELAATANGTGEVAEAEAAVLAPWYAAPEAPLAELGRVLLRRHLRRLRAAEREVRDGAPIESVHALRVATRRLRATLRLLAPVYAEGGLRPYRKAVGRLAGVAGPVRDRDVLLADLAARAPELPAELQPAVEALADLLRTEREAALTHLNAFLDSDEYAAFLRDFASMMNDSQGWNDGPWVRDLGGSTIWRHYEALRAHDHSGLPAEEAALHAMRIAGKRLRYVLELFADTLGARADDAVKPLMAFQDHLGSLNDIAIARQLLAPYARHKRAAPAVAAYLALRVQQGEHLRAELPARWEKFNSASYRRKLLDLLARL